MGFALFLPSCWVLLDFPKKGLLGISFSLDLSRNLLRSLFANLGKVVNFLSRWVLEEDEEDDEYEEHEFEESSNLEQNLEALPETAAAAAEEVQEEEEERFELFLVLGLRIRSPLRSCNGLLFSFLGFFFLPSFSIIISGLLDQSLL